MSIDVYVIEAPNTVHSIRERFSFKIFLAGGISGCRDWQKDMVCQHKHGVCNGMDGYALFIHCKYEEDNRECGKEIEWFDFCPDCGVNLSEVEYPETLDE